MPTDAHGQQDDTPWWGHVLWFGSIVTVAVIIGWISEAMGCGGHHNDEVMPSGYAVPQDAGTPP